MDSKKLAQLCRSLAENKKAENIVILDVSKLSSVTDYFVIASASNEPHVRAIVSEITDGLRDEHQLRARRVEGGSADAWQVLDFFDVIVHVMRTEVRAKYNLESLWGDAPRPATPKPKAKAKPKKAPAKKPVGKLRKKSA
jgi:ribosome silencing factor RsfS/YbeB/iojap